MTSDEKRMDIRVRETLTSVIKASIANIPIMGSFLNEALFDVHSRIKQERVEQFIQLLERKIDQLSLESVTLSKFRSDDFTDLLEDVILKATRARQKEKLKLYAGIIASKVKSEPVVEFDFQCIDIIDQLSLHELLVIEELLPYEKRHPIPSLFSDDYEPQERKVARERHQKIAVFNFESVSIPYGPTEILFGLPVIDVRLAIEGLIAKSLAYDDSFSRHDPQPRNLIGLTPLGYKVYEYLKEYGKVQEKG